MKEINEIDKKMEKVIISLRDLNDKALAEKRDYTENENKQKEDWLVEVESLKSERQKWVDKDSYNKTLASVSISDQKSEETSEEKPNNKFVRAFGEYLLTGVVPKEYRGKLNGFAIPVQFRGVTSTTTIGTGVSTTVEPGVVIAKPPSLEVLEKLGVKMVKRSKGAGNYIMHSAAHATGTTPGETVAVADASLTPVTNILTPTRSGAYNYFTIEEEAVFDPQSQADLIKDLYDVVWDQVSYNYFDNLETDAALADAGTIAGSSLANEDFTNLQVDVEERAQVSNGKYATTPKVAGVAKNLAKISNISGPVWEGRVGDGTVDGVPGIATPFCNTDILIYGDFSKSTVCQWGEIEVQLNPFEKDAEGEIKVVARGLFDSGVANYRFFSFIDASVS